MLFLFASLAAAAPLQTLDIPVERSSSSIPVAAQQRYLSRAVAEAVAQLDFAALRGRTVSIQIAGVLQMSNQQLGDYVRQELISHVALAGGRANDDSADQLVVRIGQAGIDHVLESREVRIPRRKGLPITLMAVGSALAVTGAVWAAESPWDSNVAVPVAGVGAAVAGGGVGLLFLPPKRDEVACDVFRARATIDATYIPATGDSWSTRGASDILVDDEGLPCDAEARARLEER